MNYTKMGITNEEYAHLVEEKSPRSNIIKNCIVAFIIGGLICVIGQIITNIGMSFGLDKKTASTITTIILIFIAALLTAIRVYERIGKVAGAGTIVPITGFANSLTSSALESKSEGIITGILTNMFKLAGAVIAAGIISAFIVGTVIYLIRM